MFSFQPNGLVFPLNISVSITVITKLTFPNDSHQRILLLIRPIGKKQDHQAEKKTLWFKTGTILLTYSYVLLFSFPLLWDIVRKLTLKRESSLNIFRIKSCWHIVFLCIIFSPFCVFIKWKSLKKITDVFSLLTFDSNYFLHSNRILT